MCSLGFKGDYLTIRIGEITANAGIWLPASKEFDRTAVRFIRMV